MRETEQRPSHSVFSNCCRGFGIVFPKICWCDSRDAAGAAALQIRGGVGRWVSTRGLQGWAGRASSHWSVGGARQATICSNRLDVPIWESALAPRGLSWVFSPQPLMPLHRPRRIPAMGRRGGNATCSSTRDFWGDHRRVLESRMVQFWGYCLWTMGRRDSCIDIFSESHSRL